MNDRRAKGGGIIKVFRRERRRLNRKAVEQVTKNLKDVWSMAAIEFRCQEGTLVCSRCLQGKGEGEGATQSAFKKSKKKGE